MQHLQKHGVGSRLWLTRNPIRITVLSDHREQGSTSPNHVGHESRVTSRRVAPISVYLRRWRFRVLLESASRLTISLQCVSVLTSPVVGRMAASISRSMYSLSRHRLRRWAQLISPGGNRFCRADHSFDEQAGKQLTV